jgi:hypothetical protein
MRIVNTKHVKANSALCLPASRSKSFQFLETCNPMLVCLEFAIDCAIRELQQSSLGCNFQVLQGFAKSVFGHAQVTGRQAEQGLARNVEIFINGNIVCTAGTGQLRAAATAGALR